MPLLYPFRHLNLKKAAAVSPLKMINDAFTRFGIFDKSGYKVVDFNFDAKTGLLQLKSNTGETVFELQGKSSSVEVGDEVYIHSSYPLLASPSLK